MCVWIISSHRSPSSSLMWEELEKTPSTQLLLEKGMSESMYPMLPMLLHIKILLKREILCYVVFAAIKKNQLLKNLPNVLAAISVI